MVLDLIQKFPVGYSIVKYNGVSYGLTRTDLLDGKSIKIFADELGGTDFISLNLYLTSSSELLKPCEMSERKVLDFLEHSEYIP